MLRILNSEEIQRNLSEISVLVDMYEDKNPFFSQKVKDWLSRTEKVLENNKLAFAGQLAGLRASVISAERGFSNEGITFSGPQSKRKMTYSVASKALQEAGAIITSNLQGDFQRFSEAEKQTMQLVTFFLANGSFAPFKNEPLNTETLQNMWQVIKSDPNLAPGALNIESLVGPVDSLILFSRTIGVIKQT